MSQETLSQNSEVSQTSTKGTFGFKRRFKKVYTSHTNIDFPRIWPRAFVISLVLLLATGLGWGIRGLNLGLEFEGGTAWELQSASTSVDGLRDSLRPFGQGDALIQSLGGDRYLIRAEVDNESENIKATEIRDSLAQAANINSDDVSIRAESPSFANEIASKAQVALYVFIGVLAVYIWVRLEWQMTVAALVAVAHDILITVGIYALFQFDVTPATLIAFLTILGYSLYDTLVVFDKIKENEKRREEIAYPQLVSRSMNQVMMRSINTTITSVLPVATLLIVGRFILGAVVLADFAIALLIGLLAGTYSSIFVATPLVALLKERKLKITTSATKEKSGKEAEGNAPLKRVKKGMLAQSKVVSRPRTTAPPAPPSMPRPQKKKKGR